jgi:hypothetical protein
MSFRGRNRKKVWMPHWSGLPGGDLAGARDSCSSIFGGALLFVLLMLGVADRVVMKRNLEIVRDIRNQSFRPAEQGSAFTVLAPSLNVLE